MKLMTAPNESSDDGLNGRTRAQLNSSYNVLGDCVRADVSSAKHLWPAGE